MKVKKVKRKKANKKKLWLQKLVRINIAVILILGVFYMSAGFSLDSGFFVRDAQKKYAMAAETTLRVKVIDAPSKPILIATPSCYRGVPRVDLSWEATTDTDYYNIERDGSFLTTGLTSTNYRDEAVVNQTTYQYAVTAVGPIGSVMSDPVSITTPDDCPALPVPAIFIETLDNIEISQFTETPTITNRTPAFTGNTNIPEAIIQIEVFGSVPTVAQIQANENGYWSWKVSANLNYGSQIIKVTAIDPEDALRRESVSLEFNIIKPEEESDSEKKKHKEKKTLKEEIEQKTISIIPGPYPTPAPTPTPEIIIPFRLFVNVENQNKEVLAGEDLLSRVHIQKIQDFSPQEIILHYQIFDSSNKIVLEQDDQVFIKGDTIIHKKIKIPGLLRYGKYKVFVSTSFRGVIINAGDSFKINEMVFLNLRSGKLITMTGIMENISCIILWLLLLLIIFLVLLCREYYLSKQAKVQVTEGMLYEDGLF